MPQTSSDSSLHAQVLDAIRKVDDPELRISIVDLGLVYDVAIERGVVAVLMTKTTPFCPLDDYFKESIAEGVGQLSGITEVHVQFTFDPPWDKSRITEAGREALGI